MANKLLAIALMRLHRADRLCTTEGATIDVARAYRDAYKAFDMLSRVSADAARLADVASSRANTVRGLL